MLLGGWTDGRVDGWMVDAPLAHAASSGKIRIGQGRNRAFARSLARSLPFSLVLSHPVSPHAALHILARTHAHARVASAAQAQRGALQEDAWCAEAQVAGL